jgi:hypothetical protein
MRIHWLPRYWRAQRRATITTTTTLTIITATIIFIIHHILPVNENPLAAPLLEGTAKSQPMPPPTVLSVSVATTTIATIITSPPYFNFIYL